MEDHDMPTADASLLARMMELKSDEGALWEADDLEGILEHQLAAPLEADLADLLPGLRGRLTRSVSASDPLWESSRVRCQASPEPPRPVPVPPGSLQEPLRQNSVCHLR